MYQGIIFDLDGTLLDTLNSLADSCNYALRKVGLPEYPADDYRYFVGNGVQVLIEKITAVRPEYYDKVKELYENHYRTHCMDAAPPYPGILSLLDRIEKNKIKAAVLSNKPHEFTVKMIAASFPDYPFSCVYGNQPEIPRKPDPAGVLNILQRFALPKESVLYVGDTATDMLTAKNAGLTAAGVLWGFRGEEELRESGADFIVKETEALLKLLIEN